MLLVVVSDSEAQIGAPVRPVVNYQNSVSGGLSYGIQNDRHADFWGWSVAYSRSLVGHWFTEANISWDRETQKRVRRPFRAESKGVDLPAICIHV